MTDRLTDYLEAEGVDADLMSLEAPARTVPDAARLLGVAEKQVIKSIVVTDGDGATAVLVVGGTAQADLAAAAKALGWDHARMADPTAAREATGFAIGGTPPVGHARRLPVLVDEQVMRLSKVYGGGGRPERLLALPPARILEATGGSVARIAEAPR